jgi:hypothetical protein
MRRAIAPLTLLAGLLLSTLPADADPPGRWHPIPSDTAAAVAARPSVELIDDGAGSLPTFSQTGRRFVLGAPGERYRIRLSNPTASRVEAVISVDGLDAVDGKPATLTKRGYLVPAHGEIVVDGWRTSLDTVAAFRFSAVPDSYAAMTGHDRNIGVVGVAFFREQPPPPPRPPVAWRGLPSPSARSSGDGLHDAEGASAARPGLGTQFGESHESHIEEVDFRRADARPVTVSELRYDDRQGLVARGIPLPPRDQRDAENDRRDRAQPFAESRFAQPPR